MANTLINRNGPETPCQRGVKDTSRSEAVQAHSYDLALTGTAVPPQVAAATTLTTPNPQRISLGLTMDFRGFL